MGWYNSSWDFRKKITIDNTKVTGDLTDFPVLLSLTFAAGEKGSVNADGSDIRITTSDGTMEIPREIESYDQSTGVFVGWTKVDVLDLTDVVLYIYYGNSGASEPAEDATYGRENVWDSNFMGVWHLNQDPNGDVADSILDSTSGDDDLDPDGTMLTADLVDSKIGKGIDFDGGDDTLRGSTVGGKAITGAFTVEAWIKTGGAGQVGIVTKYSGTNDAGQERNWRSYGLFMDSDEKLKSSISSNGAAGGNLREVTGSTALDTGAYLQAVVVFIPSTSLTLYVNGVQDGQNTTSMIASIADTSAWFRVSGWSGPPAEFFAGEIDEVRVSDTNRSLIWIQTSYANQNSPGTFYSVGGQEIGIEAEATFEAEASISIAIGTAISATFEAEASISIAIGASPTMSRIMTAIKSALLGYNGTGETLEDIKTFKRGKALKTLIHPAIFIRPIRESFPKIWTGGKYDAEKELEIRVAAKNLNALTALYKAMEYAEAIRDILAPAHGNLDWNFSGIVWNAELGNVQIGEQTETKGGFVQECILPATYMAKETFPTETDYTTLSEYEPKDLLDLVFTLVNGDSTLSGIKLWSKGRTPPRLRFPACSIIPDEAEYEPYESEHDKRILNLQVLIFTKVLDKETSIDNNLALAELMKDVLQKNVRWGGYARNSEFDIDYETYQTDNGFLYGSRFNLALDSREKL